MCLLARALEVLVQSRCKCSAKKVHFVEARIVHCCATCPSSKVLAGGRTETRSVRCSAVTTIQDGMS